MEPLQAPWRSALFLLGRAELGHLPHLPSWLHPALQGPPCTRSTLQESTLSSTGPGGRYLHTFWKLGHFGLQALQIWSRMQVWAGQSPSPCELAISGGAVWIPRCRAGGRVGTALVRSAGWTAGNSSLTQAQGSFPP